MTEAEWLACTDPRPMLALLRGTAGERKLRLFACACVRLAWDLLDEPSRKVLVASERYADGEIHRYDLAKAARVLRGDTEEAWRIWESGDRIRQHLRSAAQACGNLRPRIAADWVLNRTDCVHEPVLQDRFRTRCDLLRDIFGNPFRPVTADPHWLSSTVVSLAHAIYAGGAFDRLPILADALEDAGCDDADILSHCRGDGPHVRGCWVVDLILGKE